MNSDKLKLNDIESELNNDQNESETADKSPATPGKGLSKVDKPKLRLERSEAVNGQIAAIKDHNTKQVKDTAQAITAINTKTVEAIVELYESSDSQLDKMLAEALPQVKKNDPISLAPSGSTDFDDILSGFLA